MTDLELLDRYRQRGDRIAFDRLVERYYSLVLRVCRRQLKNDADADDAAQQVFCHLLSQAPRVHSNVAAWLHRCAHNVSVSLVRSSMARRRTEQAYLETGSHTNGNGADAEMLRALDECLASMGQRDRELIIQTQLLRVPQRVLAHQRGVSQQAVAKQLARSMDLLRTAISARGFALSAVALAAALESEAAAALVSLGAAGGAGVTGVAGLTGTAGATVTNAVATTGLTTTAGAMPTGAASTLALATKLRVAGSAVAGLMLLSMPGAPERSGNALPLPARAAQMSADTFANTYQFAANELPVEPARIAPPLDDVGSDPHAVAAPNQSRRPTVTRRAIEDSAPRIAMPAPSAPPAMRETGVPRPQQGIAQGAPAARNLPERDLSRWPSRGAGNIALVPTPLQDGPPEASPPEVAPPEPVRLSGKVTPRVQHGLPSDGTRPVKPNSTSVASGGGASGGGASAGGAPTRPSGSNSGAATSPSPSNLATSKPSATSPPSSGAPSPNGVANGAARTTPLSSKPPAPTGGSHVVAPPHVGVPSPPHAGPSHTDGYELSQIAFRDDGRLNRGPPGEFIVSVGDRGLAVALDVSTGGQFSVPNLRMPGYSIDPMPSLPPVVQLAGRPEAGYDAAGLSPRSLVQIGGDDPYAAVANFAALDDARAISHAGGDAYALAGLSGDIVSDLNAWCVDGQMVVADYSPQYATQISTVPEPAAWLLAAVAVLATLAIVLCRTFRLGTPDRRASEGT